MASFPECSRIDLGQLYPGTESSGIALLYRMLEFNPNKRITAEEAMKDAYFDDVRLPEQECLPPPHIDLSVDDEGNEPLSIDDLKKLAVEAIEELSSDKFDFENDFGEEEGEEY